jgi:hypothetical protein
MMGARRLALIVNAITLEALRQGIKERGMQTLPQAFSLYIACKPTLTAPFAPKKTMKLNTIVLAFCLAVSELSAAATIKVIFCFIFVVTTV